MDTTRSQPTRPRISFLNLPREIRDSIYHLALHRSVSLRPIGKISYFCQLYGHLRQRETCVSISSPPFHPATPLAISVSKLLNPELPLELLRVNKQIHEEAAEALYGGNHFKFIIGPTARVRQMLGPMGTTTTFAMTNSAGYTTSATLVLTTEAISRTRTIFSICHPGI